MNIELIPEPKIEFGNNVLCDDPKMGITLGNFFSSTNNLHRSEIHYGVIGTNNNIQLVNDWLREFDNKIEASAKTEILENPYQVNDEGEVLSLFDIEGELESEDLKVEIFSKKLNPDFPGIGFDSPFKCILSNDPINNIRIREEDIINILEDKKKPSINKFEEIIKIYKAAFDKLLGSISKPDICIVIIDKNIFKKIATVKIGNQKLNFRRRLKAELLSFKNCIPLQFMLEDTLTGTKKSMQDLSMIAWNFIVAQYYKCGGIPWALTNVDKNTCYIGISFHKILNKQNNILRSSIAQAFDYKGKGLIFIGKQFEWNSAKTKSKSPHLTYEYSKELVEKILTEYKNYTGASPSRVVIHKTTNFWNANQSNEFCETEGFNDGIRKTLDENVDIDLITIKSSNIKLLRRQGKYPVIRGTHLKITNKTGILYTTGYIPYYETFPGVHVPLPLQIDIFQGETTLRDICSEIMAFTKMNFNNCNYYDSLPITIRFAKRVGEIVQYFEEDVEPPNLYCFYM